MVSLDRDMAHHTRVESDDGLEPPRINRSGDLLAPPFLPRKAKGKMSKRCDENSFEFVMRS